jgi:hypothetical protein
MMKTIARMLYKACPRCHGDLALDEYERHDTGELAYECLQCGRRAHIVTPQTQRTLAAAA